MALARTFFNDFRPLFRMLEEPLLAPTFTRFPRHNAAFQRHTPVEFAEDGNDVLVRAEVPGVQKEHLDIRLGNDGQSLTIEGRVLRDTKVRIVDQTKSAETGSAAPAESSESEPDYRSSFSRTFWLPQAVNGTKGKAELADGVLTLRLPKREESRGERIPIA